MPTFHLTTTIHAPIHRVWRALCDPTEVTTWDATVTEALDAPPDYPQPGHHVRWRIASPNSPLRKRGGAGGGVLHDHPQYVEPPTRLHSHLTIGRDHLDETYTLTPIDSTTTQLDCHVTVTHHLPLLGPLIARLRTLPATRASFETSLTNLKHHCENTNRGQHLPSPQGEA
jgi:uncharacterized protein YndB with AHSA1/START domain